MRGRYESLFGAIAILFFVGACQGDETASDAVVDPCAFSYCAGSSGLGNGGAPGGGATNQGAGGVTNQGATAGIGGFSTNSGGSSAGGSGVGGSGGSGPGGGGSSAGGTGGTAGSIGSGGAPGSGGAISDGGSGTGGTPAACEAGTTTTAWAQNCATVKPACTPGSFTAPGSTTNDPLGYESEHFAFYWPSGNNYLSNAQQAATILESTIWTSFTGSPMFFPEPYCDTANKRKVSVVIHSDYGLTGGGWGSGNIGMWIGPGATSDHWGLAHEFTHALQASSGGLANSSFTGWMWESHANWHTHQLAEFHDDNVHCSELLVNFPHLYLGSTRDRYCNWQFMEYLKDKYCYAAVEDIWSKAPKSGTAQRTADPFSVLRANMSWDVSHLNDFFGEWAMHNVTWDYRNPDGSDQGPVYRNAYGKTGDVSGNARGAPAGFRRLRTTGLDALDLANRRFVTPSGWAPQRWGYNVLRLYPDSGAASVTVTFRGVVQTSPANTNFGTYDNQPASIPNPSSDWRWGLVAVDAAGTARYSALQRGADGELTFCVDAGDSELWLVVMATPSENQQIMWDQMYYTIYRYPWMVELGGAMPEGYQPNAPNPTSSGQRWPNGGGWVSASATVASSVYVGPSALVLGGSLSGNARVDGHAVVVSGNISGSALIDGLSVISGGLTVSNSAHVGTVFQGPGTFEARQVVSGSGQILGDVELRGAGIDVSRGIFYGFIDSAVAGDAQQGANRTAPPTEVTTPGPYAWRP